MAPSAPAGQDTHERALSIGSAPADGELPPSKPKHSTTAMQRPPKEPKPPETLSLQWRHSEARRDSGTAALPGGEVHLDQVKTTSNYELR